MVFVRVVETILLKYASTIWCQCCDELSQKAINRPAETEMKSDVSVFGELPSNCSCLIISGNCSDGCTHSTAGQIEAG